MLPHGPEDSVRGLCRWLSTESSREMAINVLIYIKTLAELAPAETVPWLATSRALAEGIVNLLERTHNRWQPTQSRDDDSYTALVVDTVADMLESLMNQAEVAETKEFFRDTATPLFVVCFRALALMRALRTKYSRGDDITTRFPQSENGYRYLASDVYNAATEEARARLPVAPHVDRAVMREIAAQAQTMKSEEGELWLHLSRVLRSLHERPRCQNAGCPNTFALAGGGRAFQHCGGCKMVPYCSQACQKAGASPQVVGDCLGRLNWEPRGSLEKRASPA
jgi:hypothetical protein